MDNECTLVLYQNLEFPDMATDRNAYSTHIGIELPNGNVVNLETGHIYLKEDFGERLIDNKSLYIIHRYSEWQNMDCIDFEDEVRYSKEWWENTTNEIKEKTTQEIFEEAPVGSMIYTECNGKWFIYYKANEKWSIMCGGDMNPEFYRPQDMPKEEKVTRIITNPEQVEDMFRYW